VIAVAFADGRFSAEVVSATVHELASPSSSLRAVSREVLARVSLLSGQTTAQLLDGFRPFLEQRLLMKLLGQSVDAQCGQLSALTHIVNEAPGVLPITSSCFIAVIAEATILADQDEPQRPLTPANMALKQHSIEFLSASLTLPSFQEHSHLVRVLTILFRLLNHKSAEISGTVKRCLPQFAHQLCKVPRE
jgi:hypothetical protein